MKNITAAILTLASLHSFSGIKLSCEVNFIEQRDDHSFHYLVVEQALLACRDKKTDEQYSVLFNGIGPGLELDLFEKYSINCPTVNKRKLKKKGKVSFIGAKLGLGLYGSFDAGIALNFKGGSCILGSIGSGLGAGASIGKMSILKGRVELHRGKLLF